MSGKLTLTMVMLYKVDLKIGTQWEKMHVSLQHFIWFK